MDSHRNQTTEPDAKTESMNNGKTPVVSKSFLAVGPTLHYSHSRVEICWGLALLFFGLTCLLWSKITGGTFWALGQLDHVFIEEAWQLDRFIDTGISIFEYPWQILVLGLLMGIFCIVPILTAQLLSFAHSLPFIGALLFLAGLPGMAVTLVVSCIGVACRPLRFRSRIISIALCMAPQLVYWGYFGGARGQEPIGWGVSFAPWIASWLTGLLIAGIVLGFGHITRYKPGLIWTTTLAVLIVALLLFEAKIGFDELAFYLHVSENNPEEASEFHGHSVTQVLDDTIMDSEKRKYLKGFFYPTDPIDLRQELKRELLTALSYNREGYYWPAWVDKDRLPDQLRYHEKRDSLLTEYDRYIDPSKAWWMPGFLHRQLVKQRATSKRMPIALYYRAMLLEYAPDILALEQDEVLTFYSDHPYERARETWYRLYGSFRESPEALEAYWRIAKHWAGSGRFEHAENLLAEARKRVDTLLEKSQDKAPEPESIFTQFRAPAETVMTPTRLMNLRSRLDRLASLIGPENRDENPEGNSSLAKFVMLNPYTKDYEMKLSGLLNELAEDDRLYDNVLLAKTKLQPDDLLRERELQELHKKYTEADGGMESLFELGLLKIRFFQNATDDEQKKEHLVNARVALTTFLNLYPESIFIARVKQNLMGLPDVSDDALFELTLHKIRLYQNATDEDQKKKLLQDALTMLNNFLILYPESSYNDRVKQNLAELLKVE